MNILVDDLEYDEIDFSVYYNEDGEPEEIEEMDDTELKNNICALERQLKMLPEHYNAEIWEEYKHVMKKELQERAVAPEV